MNIPTVFPARTSATRYSELNSWSQCRTKWFYQYYLGLQPAITSKPIRRGILGHAGLRALDMGEDYKQVVDQMVEIYLNALAPVVIDGEEVSISDQADSLATMATEVKDQIQYYEEYYPRWKNVLAAEQQYTIRVEGSPILINGTWDAIVEDDHGTWLLERKWVDQYRNPEMFDLDGQLAIYHMAAKAVGYDITGIIVDQIGPNPKKPKLNLPKKDGTREMSRVKLGDWRTYKLSLIAAGLDPNDYLDMKEALPECSAFRRDLVYRSDIEIELYQKDLLAKIGDLCDQNKRIYMADDRIRCATCHYREICIERVKGGDVEYVLENNFVVQESPYENDLEPTIA